MTFQMLREGNIPMNPAEEEALEALMERYSVTSATRRDPGETGPVLVHADEIVFEIDEDGKVTSADG